VQKEKVIRNSIYSYDNAGRGQEAVNGDGVLSDNHLDPDVAVESFVLEPPSEEGSPNAPRNYS
jgi:hypothetical protein